MMMRIFFYDSVRFFQIFGITKYYFLTPGTWYRYQVPDTNYLPYLYRYRTRYYLGTRYLILRSRTNKKYEFI